MAGPNRQGQSSRGDAGRKGEDVRSDLHVVIETEGRHGIDIDLRSRVEPYYGRNIDAQVRRVLDELGVRDAHVTIEDKGALPFVIAARIETAVRRGGLGDGRIALPPPAIMPPASAKERLRRSRLYLPGTEPKFFINAGLHKPDAVILDLEDSVHPAEKDGARILVRNALWAVDFGGAERMVRINQLPLGLLDLDEVVPMAPDMILLPKVERREQVEEVDIRIAAIVGQRGIKRPVWLMPILESAQGVENAYAIACGSKRIAALTIGLEDYTADLGVVKTTEGRESLYARSRLVNAARAAGMQPIDSVFGDVGDMDGLRAWAAASRALGFEGMGCIHPRQIPVIHEAFAPSGEELEKAQKIVAAFEEAKSRGLGVVSLGTKMIDPPVVNRAQKLVRQARLMGMIPPGSPTEEKPQ